MVRAARWSAILLSGLVGGACLEEPRACTDMGCIDSAGFILNADWEGGVYAMTVRFDADIYSCTFTLPDLIDSAVGQGITIPIPCTPELDASLDAVVTCTTHSDGNSSSQICTPVPGRYYLSAQTTTLADSLSVTVTRDGKTYFEGAQPLAYTVYQPNGPSCDPSCRNATAVFQVEYPVAPQP